jgi:cytochrome c-type biogenesis protein CcmH
LTPRFERQTVLRWLVPPLLLVGGGLALWVYARRRVKDGEAGKALTAQEQARLAALLSAETPAKEP